MLYGRLRVESQHELVSLGVDDLLGEIKVRDASYRDEQRDVSLPQLEHGALVHGTRQQLITQQNFKSLAPIVSEEFAIGQRE